jgi:hypothetical protein
VLPKPKSSFGQRSTGLQGRGRGFDMGSITVPDRTLQRQKEPSVTLVFCKLRPSFSLSRQRSGPDRFCPAKQSYRRCGDGFGIFGVRFTQ